MGCWLSGYLNEPFIEFKLNNYSGRIGGDWTPHTSDQENYRRYGDFFFAHYSENWREESQNFLEAKKLAELNDSQVAVTALAMYLLNLRRAFTKLV